MGWVCNEKRIYSIDKFIFAFLRQNNQRVNVKDIIEFMIEGKQQDAESSETFVDMNERRARTALLFALKIIE